MIHRQPGPRSATRACFVAAASLAATVCGGPAAAAPYYWSYGAGCASSDFTGTCWSPTLGGAGGATLPFAAAEVFVQQAGNVSLPVTFANAATGRDMTVGALSIEGTGSASAALAIARNQLTTTSTTVGAAGKGRIDLSGGGHVVSGGDLLVGNLGGAVGVYNITGGTLGTTRTAIGNNAGAAGSMTIAGAGARWVDSIKAYVGVAGVGSLAVSGGARVDLTTLETSVASTGESSVTVQGAGTQFSVSDFVILGDKASTHWAASAGATLQTGYVVAGYRPGGVADIVIDGAGTRWTNLADFNLGNEGTASTRVSNGGVLSSRSVTLGTTSTLLLQGGTIETVAFNRAAGSSFVWTTGTLRFKASANGAALGSNGLDLATTLHTGQVLQADDSLTLGSGSVLLLNGGAVKTPSLRLTGGSIAAVGNSPLDMTGVAVLSGSGSVAAALRGGAGSVIAVQGALALGRLDLPNAIAYDGVLSIGSAQVVLLDSTRAQLGLRTVLSGGVLASVNGARIGSGQQLISSISSSVQGRFTNDGAVQSQSGRLTFVDDVDGGGSFAGDVLFRAGYAPGSGAVRVAFNGGNASFDDHALLTLQIAGSPASGLYDRLDGIGALRFDGRLVLDFSSAAAPEAGSRYDVFGFTSFAGSLASDRIDVVGFDRSQLDLSRLGVDGSLTVTAVPEPATWALWLTAAGATAAWTRRRRRC